MVTAVTQPQLGKLLTIRLLETSMPTDNITITSANKMDIM